MRETHKTKELWKPDSLELKILRGKGLDIGAGDDPIFPDVRIFDEKDGDANEIGSYIKEQFDYVYSSHCLEHMHDPRKTILEWWKLVKPGGHLYFTVPDEDLYEQGVFPSRFNPDHKATFTISKAESWSPVSINVLDLANSLPNGEIIRLALQDHNYDRRLMTFGRRLKKNLFLKIFKKIFRNPRLFLAFEAVDQTRYPETLAQIVCIVRKKD